MARLWCEVGFGALAGHHGVFKPVVKRVAAVHGPWQLANAPRIACAHPGHAGKWPISVGVKAATAMSKAAMALNAAMAAALKAKAFPPGQAHHPQR